MQLNVVKCSHLHLGPGVEPVRTCPKHRWTLSSSCRGKYFRSRNIHRLFHEVFCRGVQGSIQSSPESIYAAQNLHPFDPGIIHTVLFNRSSLEFRMLCRSLAILSLKTSESRYPTLLGMHKLSYEIHLNPLRSTVDTWG